MAADGSVIIDVLLNDENFRSGIKKLGKTAAVGAGVATAAIAGATVALGAYIKNATLAAEADQTVNQSMEQVATSMNLYGDAVSDVTKRLQDLATKQAIATGVDDLVIKKTQTKLLTFRELAKSADEVGGMFDRATTAAIDLAAAGFGEAEGNAVQLGKALNDPTKGLTALTRSGITFTKAEKDKIKALQESGDMLGAQTILMEAIETQVGGTAEASASVSEQWAVMSGELKESVGAAFLPLLDDILPGLIDAFNMLSPILETFGGGIAAIFGGDFEGGGEQIQQALTDLAGFISESLPTLVPVISNIILGLVTAVIQAVPTVLPVLITGLVNLISTVASMLPTLIPPLIDGLVLSLLAIVEALPGAIGYLVEGMVALFDALIEVMPVLIPPVVEAIVEMVPMLVEGLIALAPTLVEAAVVLIATLLDALADELFGDEATLGDIGKNLVEGLWNGIKNMGAWIGEKIRGFGSGILTDLKSFFGIASPSKLFEKEIGVNLALGVGAGFEKSVKGVMSSMSASLNGEMARFTMSPAASNTTNTTINFNGRVQSYAETVRAMRDIESGLAW